MTGEREQSPLSLDQRIDLWDAVLGGVRGYFKQEGLREVSTPVRVAANAVEPYIEPLAWRGAQLQTSPELCMKQLLGSRSIYQVAHCFRQGEQGARHREEFHLIEWYRVGGSLAAQQRDIECMVARASYAAALVLQEEPTPPRRWRRLGWLELFEAQTGTLLRGDESASELEPLLRGLRVQANLESQGPALPASADVAQLVAWSELFSLWSDARLDPWLATLPEDEGVHLVDFPAPLAALARSSSRCAMRFESYFRGVELANAYDELRDANEQQRRFERVNALRVHQGLESLPISQPFLGFLRDGRLPASVGAAMGLERILSTVCYRAHLSEVELCEPYAGAPPSE